MAYTLANGLRRLLIVFFSWLHRLILYTSHGGLLNALLGRRVLLLTTTGRKTGKQRTRPLIYLEYNNDFVVVASYGGNPYHPAWYLNLKANPDVRVQVGNKHYSARAETADAELRAVLWPKLVAMWPGYSSYQTRTSREIPVVILKQQSDGSNENGSSSHLNQAANRLTPAK